LLRPLRGKKTAGPCGFVTSKPSKEQFSQLKWNTCPSYLTTFFANGTTLTTFFANRTTVSFHNQDKCRFDFRPDPLCITGNTPSDFVRLADDLSTFHAIRITSSQMSILFIDLAQKSGGELSTSVARTQPSFMISQIAFHVNDLAEYK